MTENLLASIETVKRLLGDDYPERVKQVEPFVRAEMDKHQLAALPAAIRIATDLATNRPSSEVTQILLLAAAVEMVAEE